MTTPDQATMRAEANRLVAYHSPISAALTDERRALESKLIPVSAYVLISCLESWYRYPSMMEAIDAALPAEELGRAARRPGCQVNSVHLWSVANLPLLGRKVLTALDPSSDRVEPLWRVLDFWQRAALGFRGDGTRQAWDTGTATPYDQAVVTTLLDAVVPVDEPEQRQQLVRFNATLIAYLFLLYFDTRVGAGDTGPYPLPDGRVLLVRDYYQLGRSHFWWSDVAAEIPYQDLTAAFVLDGVRFRVTDFGSSYHEPEDYLDHLVGFSLFTTDAPDRSLRPVPLDELGEITTQVRRAQAAHYRNVATMSRDEKIRCGAYVYFTFLKPFAELAGVADQLDWTAPRDVPPPLYELFSQFEGGNAGVDPNEAYYAPFAD